MQERTYVIYGMRGFQQIKLHEIATDSDKRALESGNDWYRDNWQRATQFDSCIVEEVVTRRVGVLDSKSSALVQREPTLR